MIKRFGESKEVFRYKKLLKVLYDNMMVRYFRQELDYPQVNKVLERFMNNYITLINKSIIYSGTVDDTIELLISNELGIINKTEELDYTLSAESARNYVADVISKIVDKRYGK